MGRIAAEACANRSADKGDSWSARRRASGSIGTDVLAVNMRYPVPVAQAVDRFGLAGTNFLAFFLDCHRAATCLVDCFQFRG